MRVQSSLLLLWLALGLSACAQGKETLVLKVNEHDAHRYIRVEASGDVEFSRNNWYEILEFRKGQISQEKVRKFFQEIKSANLAQFADTYAPPQSDTPSIDPSEARLEWRAGSRKKVIVYSLRDAPQALQKLHQKILNVVYEFPDGAPPGDYLRTYELFDKSLMEVGGYKPLPMTTGELAKHPGLRTSIEQPGRLIKAGPPGESWERGKSTVDPTGFFLELEGHIFRVLVLDYQPKNKK